MKQFTLKQLDSVNSTNLYVKEHRNELTSKTVVYTTNQTNGYGRLQRNWESSEYKNLAMSILLKMNTRNDLSLLTQLCAASIHNTLLEFGIDSQIKWPNDILVQNKKLCGILVETIHKQDQVDVILGIGINVNQTEFKADIINRATSMKLEQNKEFNIYEVLTKALHHINEYLIQYETKTHTYLEVCREHSFLNNKEITLENGTKAIYQTIDDLGRLVVRINNQIQVYTGSEITLHNMYKVGE